MKKYLLITLLGLAYQSSSAMEIYDPYTQDKQISKFENQVHAEGNPEVNLAIERLDHCRRVFNVLSNSFEEIWLLIEYELVGRNDILDDFWSYKSEISDMIGRLDKKMEEAIEILQNSDDMFNELKPFRDLNTVNEFIGFVSETITYCSDSRESLGDERVEYVMPILRNLTRSAVILQKIFLFEGILGKQSALRSNCCVLI